MTYPRDCAHCGKRVLRPNGMFMALLWLRRPVSLHHDCVRTYLEGLRAN